ncbi:MULTISPECIES: YlmC/YmxH family sporulation protein [Clostridium]|uniref:Sporulation protein, YlmC/YmxH family n=1 Tax=Clostridium cadaveris TaxID=1529 RepID=A0A1I2JBZ5_9CLOT|nr:YlmC/YmxH family sporulation protein [Clostridium cadaveris]MDU4952454.1 YlmC/YmxH family sporulation protein [Clostridium sp.]MDM8312157.1 YlmC/YmxH family sporulation protein [Clostridium cadaveris]MDY4948345.1 YlmC/YmxH family sporulation protein [Clostridium cadaveris]NME64116.1 YlmC/YmxH family sporulation protein [Clostridium cadaveris]NWK10358.1 YlmC/YmxH family sporulation protein [Clostridium cadaveris]
MGENIKLYSQLERYEIININDGEKYNLLGNNDVVIDDEGFFKMLVVTNSQSKLSLFNNTEFLEMPWEYVKKIGVKTIIVDIEESLIKRNKL